MNSVNEWIAEATEGASWRAIAERVGTTHPTLQLWVTERPAGTPDQAHLPDAD